MVSAQVIIEKLSKEAMDLLDLVQKIGPLTKNQILVITKIKLTTLNRVIEPLITNHLLIESGTAESTGGRKPVLYDVNPSQYYLIGIDISRTYTQVVLTNLKMVVLDYERFQMTSQHDPHTTIEEISTIMETLLDKNSITLNNVLGMGVGTVGPLDREKGILVSPMNFASNQWKNVPIKDMLQNAFNLPVYIDNGANTAVLAEYHFGKGKPFDNIAYINCSIGIRTGVISSDRLIRSINDAEDAFGHMVIDVDGEKCHCGNYGCIECYSSIIAIRDKFIAERKKGRPSIITKPIEQIDFIDICKAAESKDTLSQEVLLNAAIIFGTGLANYINLLNPNLIILSGLSVKYSDLFYETCTQIALNKQYAKENTEIVFTKEGYFKDNAISVGAAVMVMEHLLKKQN